MQRFLKLFGSWIQFFYFCFDRVVINGYLSLLTRENNVVYFFREVCGVSKITKEVLRKRTDDYQKWVQAYAANHRITLEWPPDGVRKEQWVQPTLERWRKRGEFGVYFIVQSMEQGASFRVKEPKFPTQDADYMILRKQRSRFTHYYFYILDEVVGPMILRVASFLPFTVTAYLNGHNFMERELRKAGIVFTKNDNSFSAVSDVKALQEAADRFDARTIQERIEYWTLIVGPKFSDRERKACGGLHRIWSVSQVEYSLNWIFKKNWPIRDLFERSCELGLYLLTAERIANIFGQKSTRRLKGKLMNVIQRMDQGHHVFRSYWKNSFAKQYEKWRTFLRMEVVSNNLKDFGLKKTLPHWDAMRRRLGEVVDRFADTQALNLNVHGEFDLIGELSRPVVVGKTKVAGIKLESTRLMRALEVLMRGVGGHLRKWTAAEIHQAVLETFDLKPADYRLTQLRYDLRKLKAHGIIERIPKSYSYRTTTAGQKQIILLLQIRKRVYAPLAHGALIRQPDPLHMPNSKFERAYHKVDRAIDEVIELLAA
jgi:hypothetical protein